MNTEKTSPTFYDAIEERLFLLLPNDEITLKIKVTEATRLRLLFDKVNIELAQKENNIEI